MSGLLSTREERSKALQPLWARTLASAPEDSSSFTTAAWLPVEHEGGGERSGFRATGCSTASGVKRGVDGNVK